MKHCKVKWIKIFALVLTNSCIHSVNAHSIIKTAINDNLASGNKALIAVSNGNHNIASGENSLLVNTTGKNNLATGYASLTSNISGNSNNAYGVKALYLNSGNNNIAIGDSALFSNTKGNNNIAIGHYAGYSLNIGNSNIDIGNQGVANDAFTIRLGTTTIHNKTFIAGISGITASNGNAVYINSFGQLGTLTSSKRYKENINDMGKASASIMKLRPVTFYYKPEFDDGSRTLQYGLIAEEVNTILPELVSRKTNGEIDGVRYQFLAPMLLNEVQRQQQQLDQQSLEINELKKQIAQLKTLLKVQ